MKQSYQQKFIGALILSAILISNLTALGQTTRKSSGSVPSNQNKTDTKECKTGYSGTVKYTKTVTTSSTGRFGSHTDMKRVYQANFVIRDDGRQMGQVSPAPDGVSGSLTFKAQSEASETETFEDIKNTEGDDFCKITLAGAKDKRHYQCSSQFKRQSSAQGTGESTVFFGLRGRKHYLSFTNLPKLNGQSSTTSNSSCSGTCSPDKPINSSNSGVITNGGEKSAATDEDVISFNPENFNRLSGSWTRSDSTTVETFQWNLSRCAPPLEIGELHFEQKRVTSPNNWVGVDPLTGTYDGNIVKIKAKVFNNGGDTAYANVKFSETRSGEMLPDGEVSVAVKPGEAREVEYEWDTSGFAWDENKKNQSEREIKAEIQGDAETEKIKILPKPVVLVHGLWSNAAAWASWHKYLHEAHSFAWEAFPVGEDPYHGKMNTGDHFLNYDPTNSIFQNAQELGKQIKWVREQKNAWHVDIVAHSMGGLISRFYIHNFMAPVFDGKPEATHLVMLGTPNQGSACADLMYGVYNELGDKPVEALRQLKPSVVTEFNQKTFDRKKVKFSILAGYGIPATCGFEIGDGVVPLSSALFNLSDRDYAMTNHIALTDEKYFKSFVLARLAIGPKKAKNETASALLDQLQDDNFAMASENQNKFGNYFQNVALKKANDAKDANEPNNLTMRQAIKLAPKQKQEIEIPVRDGSGAGIVLLAMPYVSATLTDTNGAVIGNSPAQTDGINDYFRTIAVKKEIKSGNWKLKVENPANIETTVLVAGFMNTGSDSSLTIEAGKASPAGKIPLTAKWTENNSPVLQARITARIAGQINDLTFYDDGQHGDGAANDGVYGSSVEKLPKGEYFVEAKAEANSQTKFAVTQIMVGSSVPAKK